MLNLRIYFKIFYRALKQIGIIQEMSDSFIASSAEKTSNFSRGMIVIDSQTSFKFKSMIVFLFFLTAKSAYAFLRFQHRLVFLCGNAKPSVNRMCKMISSTLLPSHRSVFRRTFSFIDLSAMALGVLLCVFQSFFPKIGIASISLFELLAVCFGFACYYLAMMANVSTIPLSSLFNCRHVNILLQNRS